MPTGISSGGGASSVAAADITDSTPTGQALLTAANAGAARTAIGAISSVAAADITDSTSTGRSLLTASSAASARVVPVTQSWVCGGSTIDYTAASVYSSPPSVVGSEMSTSGRLGDGTTTPKFCALGLSAISALARNENGLRVTHATANSASGGQMCFPHSSGGCALLVPLPLGLEDFQLDVTIATNVENIGRAVSGADWVEVALALVRRTGTQASQVLPDYLAKVYWYSYQDSGSTVLREFSAVFGGPSSTGTFSGSPLDVSGAGEGTSGGVTERAVRIIVSGTSIEVLTGPNTSSLTRRRYYGSSVRLSGRDGLSVALGLMQFQGTPRAGYYAELRSLSVTPL
jgi:hypothetical protein